MKETNCQILSVKTTNNGFWYAIKRLTPICLSVLCVSLWVNSVTAQTSAAQATAGQATTEGVESVNPKVVSETPQASPAIETQDVIEPVISPEQPVADNLEDLKKAALELNRDLLILEEELLFPANTQVVVFLSMDIGEFFQIDSVKLTVNDKLVSSHLYTDYENNALIKGGIHRLFIGNLKQGEHEITAVFTGKGPDNREYKRAATTLIEKDDDPIMLELQVQDNTSNMQPSFSIKEWEL